MIQNDLQSQRGAHMYNKTEMILFCLMTFHSLDLAGSSIKCDEKTSWASHDIKHPNDPSNILYPNKSALGFPALCVTHDSHLASQFQASDKTLSNKRAVLILHILWEEISIN